MNILGIESSSLVASVAIVSDQVLIAEYTVNFKKTHSQTLLPMLDEIVTMVGYDLDTIDAIAVSAGPGSFTGLRIGSATGKGLGLALSKPLISVPTIDAMAYNLYGCISRVCPIMDARRNQVYTGIYECRDGFSIVKPSCAMDLDDLIDELNQAGEKVIFLGDGVPVYQERLEKELKVPFEFAPAHLNRQRAGAVAELGSLYYKEGNLVSAAEHGPEYLRKPQAEREREEALKGEANGS
ncbi:tRNA (adenosine(37)-N6)-threonylcarbamoyltransferase complex dimerization subunit type 1 TsaB [Clostridium sp. E02]|uniref:tRNA (adenosine(37)-N6)-threonylcarbamoyltransferase complex dimerization subunit type 1 TsaB n=1 Tax=Clostridium sp. E02 TaxID=2487134 RepID=UPI000F54827A|nr:tRNA (adenosine(37)-N6)-threonylcarbamoyltransferase complex dimerization subunit type 1 TsaB [Clostridium sp. E02]